MPERHRALRAAATFLGLLLLGAVVGLLASRTLLTGLSGLGLSGAEKAALAGLAVLVLPLLILWHEVGHLVGGGLVGFRPLLLVVGPVRWQREDGRWRMTANRSAALAGGLAACVPPDSRDLVRRTAALTAGGPVASLLGGAAALAAWSALSPLAAGASFATVAGHALLLVAGLGNLFLGALSLVPTRTAGFYSDGARLLRIWRGGPEMEREAALLALTGASLGGARPREWDADLVRRGIGEPDGSLFHVVGLQFAFAHAYDRAALDEARWHLERLLEAQEALPPLLRPGLLLSAASFIALEDGDAERARELIREAETGLLLDPHAGHLARGAAAWAAGDLEGAAAELALAEAALPRAVDRGVAVAAADRIRELRRRLEADPLRALA